jgi:hypothetical protein
MVQKLLADRFKLTFHYDKKELSVYVLTVGKVGLKNVTKSESPAPGFSIHVYTNLVQIPTLVLGHDRKPIARVDERRFFVSLDGGRKLRATHARLEDEDPISLTILIDLSQSSPGVMLWADQSIASLAPLSLHAKDEVSIYAMDCQLIHPSNQGATDAATLKRQVDLVLQQSQSRDQRDTKRCQNPINLWDSLASIVQTLSKRPGRRVILAVTDGVDRGSRNSWNALRDSCCRPPRKISGNSLHGL